MLCPEPPPGTPRISSAARTTATSPAPAVVRAISALPLRGRPRPRAGLRGAGRPGGGGGSISCGGPSLTRRAYRFHARVVDRVRARTVLNGSVALAVLEAGDPSRPTVVLLHGYPDTKELWREVMSRLAGRMHVVAYDVRGAGGSSAPRRAVDYDLARLGDDLLAVAGELSGGRIHLVGHDWGAIQGWEFAADPRFHGVLASFTAIAGPSLDQVSASLRRLLAAGRLLEALRRLRRSYYVALLWLPGGPQLVWRVLLNRERWRHELARREQLSPPAGYPGETLARDGITGAKLYRRNIPRRTVLPRLRSALVPVQLMMPSGDRFIPSEYYELAERFAPDVRRHTLPGSHWAPLAAPGLVADLIERFVADIESSPEASQGAVGG